MFSGGRGRVCCIEPLLFNQLASHPMNGYVIIAMATLSKVNLYSTYKYNIFIVHTINTN